MLASLAVIILAGLFAAAVCSRLHLPRIVGMLITGIICGPYVLDLLDPTILSVSAELRQIALIIILVIVLQSEPVRQRMAKLGKKKARGGIVHA